MLYLLSDDELQYAVQKCLNNAGFRVVIAFNTSARRNNALIEIQRILTDRNDYRIRSSHYGFSVEFQNGSYLSSVTATEGARGRRCHLLVVDEAIDRRIVYEVLKPLETMRYDNEFRTGFDRYIRKNPIIFDQQSFEREYICKFNVVKDNNINYPDVLEEDLFKVLCN